MGACHACLQLEGCTQEESLLCHDFAESFVGCASGVIAGAKPMALFSYRGRSLVAAGHAQPSTFLLAKVVRTYGGELARYGICVRPLSVRGGRMMVAAWRETSVDRVLARPGSRALLAGAGFDVSGSHALMAQVCSRLARFYSGAGEGGFPHELGLLFGYPLEDVVGFMRGRQATLRGQWAAYGDVRLARARFERVARVENGCKGRFRGGVPLGRLVGREEPVPSLQASE